MREVRPLSEGDLPHILDYWFVLSDYDHLIGMGADPAKMPSRNQFGDSLLEQINAPNNLKKAFCMIWTENGLPVGHCNVNQIEYGNRANMHLHLWPKSVRKKGMGTEFVKLSIPHFFKELKLKKLYCEPYAENIAPNKTLKKVGFTYVKTYRTVPGSINFEQEVNQYLFTSDDLPYL